MICLGCLLAWEFFKVLEALLPEAENKTGSTPGAGLLSALDKCPMQPLERSQAPMAVCFLWFGAMLAGSHQVCEVLQQAYLQIGSFFLVLLLKKLTSNTTCLKHWEYMKQRGKFNPQSIIPASASRDNHWWHFDVVFLPVGTSQLMFLRLLGNEGGEDAGRCSRSPSKPLLQSPRYPSHYLPLLRLVGLALDCSHSHHEMAALPPPCPIGCLTQVYYMMTWVKGFA